MRDTNMFPSLYILSSLFKSQLAHLNPLIVSSTSSCIIGCHNYNQKHTLHVSRDFHLYLTWHISSANYEHNSNKLRDGCKNLI